MTALDNIIIDVVTLHTGYIISDSEGEVWMRPSVNNVDVYEYL